MNKLRIFLVILIFGSCEEGEKENPKKYQEIEEIVIIQDSTLNIRALEILRDREGCAFLTSNGSFGSVFSSEQSDMPSNTPTIVYPVSLLHDSIVPNFRALASTPEFNFGISIGNPALLFRFDDKSQELVYREDHDKVFYDSMLFWNDKEGIAIGDPTEDCMSIIITRNGGQSWQKLPCTALPMAKDGEAAFAASDTNIAVIGDHTWVATGGKSSRIMYSADRGHTWEVFDTPIIQGTGTTGIYSIDFYNEMVGYAFGGDYMDPDENQGNKMVTHDGGKNWELIEGGPGYRSCVQYVPHSDGKGLVAVGFEGIDYSMDGGFHWDHLSDEGYYTFRFVNDSVAFAGGKGRLSKLTFRE